MMQTKLQKAARALQKSIPIAQSDPSRPRYHFAPPANWMNDPNGTIFHNGEYHLFYQFNPARPKWGNLHWGHAKSTDLVHWEHLPLALAPQGFPKESHCFSGCCVLADDGTPTIFYTSMNPQSLITRAKRYSQQWAATGSPDLITWEKHSANPILSEAIHGDQIVQQWRDPYIWKEGDHWLMVLAGEYPEEKLGRVFLYRSPDLMDWEYVSLLATDPEKRGRGWECPNYFKLGEKYVLVISPYGPVIYSIGEFDGRQHHAESWHTLDHGKDFYATNTYLDGQGRMVLVGWIKAKGRGWAGCLSLPRQLTLEDGQFAVRPVPELQSLRNSHQQNEYKLEDETDDVEFAPLFGAGIEIRARFALDAAENFGFKLFDDESASQIAFTPASRTLQVLEERAELQFVDKAQPVELHIFIDRTVMEVFINAREAFTVIFRPQLADFDSLKIVPFITKGKGYLSIDSWQLAGAPVTGNGAASPQ